ncbi:hypothetical protein [Pectobacterium colocasium]|uniref:hypothetical protein n=1 Tax=Pectobacterium colocasium TaxID=2878098 RepID=UPI001CD3C80C|nr:hypothetical protein [Pectobacterium colocasium]
MMGIKHILILCLTTVADNALVRVIDGLQCRRTNRRATLNQEVDFVGNASN